MKKVLSKSIFYRTVEKLWKITEELNILYKDNWTALADREIAIFQTELIASGLVSLADQHPRGGTSSSSSSSSVSTTTAKPPNPTKESEAKKSSDPPKDKDLYFGPDGVGVHDQDEETNFLASFLYSLSLITTVGENLG